MDAITEAVRFLLEQEKRHSDPAVVSKVNNLLVAIESQYLPESPSAEPPPLPKPSKKTKAETESPKS